MNNQDKAKININPEEIRKVLIINLGGIGDFLLSLPALKALRNFYQEANIVFLSIPRTASFAKVSPYINETLSFDFRLRQAFRLLMDLRRRKFDLALNMRTLVSWRSALKMAIVFYLIRPRYKVGRDTEKRGFFFDIRVPEEQIGDKPEYEYDLNTVRALGIKAEYSLPQIDIWQDDVSYIDNFLTKNKVKREDMLIGINPGAPYPAKRWSIENFAKVIDILNKELPCKIIITGSDDELEIARKLRGLVKSELIIATAKTPLKSLITLIKRFHLYITNDTGPMQIAAILKIPLIAIFGPGYITRFDPRNISHQAVVLYKKVDCAPCDKVTCRSMQCLKTILPEEVVEAAFEFVKKK